MSTVEFEQPDGTVTSVDAPDGDSLMRSALTNLVPGIVADCGGELSCATCHVIVDDAWIGVVGPPTGFEDEMLDATSAEREAGSRLSCQVTVGPALDGVRVRIPASQW
ncbi:2Fe-2S iron-sulfur cluster binding domain-containing protein [Rhodococcus sp. 1R11]|uniref:2Fe-2S iron-sulfur cluster-binding protein n=1 Tax=Rhodococcus sp. 1R11 TaxID=2559614 RepID=UPI00107180E3|nr:2Fe-2S iron-sulfur cluster-binding protein [Rhodococcus sp. 1R11]TFI42425.1 2Fe-2S iron-sulfur cluster binding domain-containing protein [Rhodococcus sp. 1R11]